MYRPKDWKNPFCESCWWKKQPAGNKCGECMCIFEVGADAMLNALFKLAKESPTGTFEIDSKSVNCFTGGTK